MMKCESTFQHIHVHMAQNINRIFTHYHNSFSSHSCQFVPMAKTRSKSHSAKRNSLYTDGQQKGAVAAKKYRQRKEKGIMGRRLQAGKPTCSTITMQDIGDKLQSWSDKVTNITQSIDYQNKTVLKKQQKKLEKFIKEEINCDIQWKMVQKIDMMNQDIMEPKEPEYELSILGLPWFVVKESMVAKSTDGIMQYGLFTNRTFKKDEVIGIYLGNLAPRTMEESNIPLPTHQLKNMDARGGKKKIHPLYLGLHFINDPNYIDCNNKYLNNVRVGTDYLMIALRDMKKNTELQMSYNTH